MINLVDKNKCIYTLSVITIIINTVSYPKDKKITKFRYRDLGEKSNISDPPKGQLEITVL